jgi:hypothetical protein
MKWVKIRSWHGVKSYSRAGFIQTLCGRWTTSLLARPVDTLPGGSSCETCLRIYGRQRDVS